MRFGGRTDIGLKRTVNQDNFYVGQIENTDVTLAVVCDGMGGANGGNVASELAVRVFITTFEKLIAESGKHDGEDTAELPRADAKSTAEIEVPRASLDHDVSSALVTAVARANDRVFELSCEDDTLSGMGTTIVACAVRPDGRLFTVNVGDSRMYFINADGTLSQRTHDHSFVQTLVDSGMIKPEAARTHPKRNMITRALGIDWEIDVDLFEDNIDGRSLLLCTDGFYNMTDAKELQPLFAGVAGADGTDLQRALGELIEKANAGGGDDNITVVLVTPRGQQN